MLRMSKLADYGTVVMTYLARTPEQARSASEISAGVGLGLPTVSKLLKLLVRANLLVSRRGVRGGYMLALSPEQISVAGIIDAIENYPMGLTECSSVPGLCSMELQCSIRSNWQRISQTIRAVLKDVTLAELAQPLPQAVGFDVERQREMNVHPATDGVLEVQHEHHRETIG